MSVEQFNSFLQELGAQTGFSGLAADEEGFCIFKIDNSIVLTIQYEQKTEKVVLFAEAGQVDPAFEKHVSRDLLAANYFWTGTGGATLSMHAGGCVMLAYQTPIDRMSFPDFQQTLETFINSVEFWKNRLTELQSQPKTDEAGPPDKQPTPDMRA